MKVMKILLVFLALAISIAAIFLFVQNFRENHRGEETKPPVTPPVTTDGTQAPVTDPGTQPPVTDPPATEPPLTTAPPKPPVTGPVVDEYPQAVTMYATDNDVNVRMGPSTQDARYGQLAKGEAVKVTGKTKTGWYRIVFRENYTGYVYAQYLSSTPVESGITIKMYDAPVTRWATENVNVRAGHSTNTAKLGLLDAGKSIQVTGETSNGWSVVLWEGKTAYISSTYLTDQAPEEQPPVSGS